MVIKNYFVKSRKKIRKKNIRLAVMSGPLEQIRNKKIIKKSFAAKIKLSLFVFVASGTFLFFFLLF